MPYIWQELVQWGKLDQLLRKPKRPLRGSQNLLKLRAFRLYLKQATNESLVTASRSSLSSVSHCGFSTAINFFYISINFIQNKQCVAVVVQVLTLSNVLGSRVIS